MSPESPSRTRLRFAAGAWLLVAVSYGPWACSLAWSAVRGDKPFTVDTWTLITPFIIVLGAFPGSILHLRGHTTIGSLLLALVSLNWLSWELIMLGVAKLGNPFLLMLLLLSALTILTAISDALNSSVVSSEIDQSNRSRR